MIINYYINMHFITQIDNMMLWCMAKNKRLMNYFIDLLS